MRGRPAGDSTPMPTAGARASAGAVRAMPEQAAPVSLRARGAEADGAAPRASRQRLGSWAGGGLPEWRRAWRSSGRWGGRWPARGPVHAPQHGHRFPKEPRSFSALGRRASNAGNVFGGNCMQKLASRWFTPICMHPQTCFEVVHRRLRSRAQRRCGERCGACIPGGVHTNLVFSPM